MERLPGIALLDADLRIVCSPSGTNWTGGLEGLLTPGDAMWKQGVANLFAGQSRSTSP